MRYWWVNQNQTYKHEVQGGFLWSPKRNRGGGRNQFYDNMTLVQAGDIVLSFSDAQIRAVGVASGLAVSATKPEFGRIGDQWDDEGWYVPVEFTEAANPVRPKEFIHELTPFLSPKYAPLQSNGNGNQGVYLAEVSEGFTAVVLHRMGRSIAEIAASDPLDRADDESDKAQATVQGRTDIGPTQIEQLVSARRGQGIFRANVRLNEKACRVTGVADHHFLVASHIKPWRHCDDREKLDGCNGLLLSPHIDRLFDRGFISFEADGTILRSTRLPADVWNAWGLQTLSRVPAFSPEQAQYLAYHRLTVFSAV